MATTSLQEGERSGGLLRNMSVVARISVGFRLLILLILSVGLYAYMTLSRLGGDLSAIRNAMDRTAAATLLERRLNEVLAARRSGDARWQDRRSRHRDPAGFRLSLRPAARRRRKASMPAMRRRHGDATTKTTATIQTAASSSRWCQRSIRPSRR